MFRYLPLVFKNSLRNRRRSTLTIASIAVSFCILGLLMALYHGLFLAGPATPAQALRVIVHHRVSMTQPLPHAYEDRVRRIPGVRDLTVWDWFGGVYKDARDQKNFFARFAVEPSKLFIVDSELKIPDDQRLAFEHERTGCVIGKGLADRFGFKLGDRITIVGDIFPVTMEFKVVGIYDYAGGNDSLYFNYEYLSEAMRAVQPSRADEIGTLQVMANTPEDVPRITEAIDKMFAESPYPTRTESEQAFVLSFTSFLGNLKLFLMAICGAVAFTILLVSSNTISMSVRERVREVGVLKTLGFSRESILGIVLGESAMISLIGGAVGCALAMLLSNGVRHAQIIFGFANGMIITPFVALMLIASAMILGLASSLVPAWSASRISILEALKDAG